MRVFDFLFGPPPVVPSLTRPPIVLTKTDLRIWKLPHVDEVAVACAYDREPEVAESVRLLKYGRLASMAGPVSELLDACLEALDDLGEEIVLCPVPLHWRRRLSRGFNQSQLLAEALGRRQAIAVRSLLKRVRFTGTQVGRTGEERRRALTDAFRYRSKGRCPQSVILVDDIFTTGATVDACAAALRQAGVKHVTAIALALG